MKKSLFIGLIVLIGTVAFISLTPRTGEPERGDGGKLHIVTTFAPLFIFTANIVGDTAQIENLLPSGVGPHDYSFTPADVVKIANADVVIKQGRGLDDWVDEVIRAVGRENLTIIVASEGIEPHTGTSAFDPSGGSVEMTTNSPGVAVSSRQRSTRPPALGSQAVDFLVQSDLVRPDSDDPHLWLDPFLAMQEVERIRDGLMIADPQHRDIYAREAERYLLDLLALDREIRAVLADLPKHDFVAFHPAFRYFAYEYGLREVGVIEEVPGEEPSPQELVRLVEDVRRARVEVIFSEPQFSPKIVELLARDYGLRIAELDPLETGEFRRDYYEEIIRKNVATLVRAFQ